MKIASEADYTKYMLVDVLVTVPDIQREVTLIDSFQEDAKWTLQSAVGSKTVDETNTEDTQSIKLTGEVAFMRNKDINISLVDKTGLEISFFVHDLEATSKVVMYLSGSTSMTATAYRNLANTDLKQGWNKIAFSLDSMTKNAGFDMSAPVLAIQLRIEPVTGKEVSVSFDSISTVKANHANILFTMDDGWISQYDDNYHILKSREMRGNVGLIKNKVDAIGYISKEKFNEMYDDFWDLFNHTSTHPDLSTLTKEEITTELQDCYDWLVANNFGRAGKTVAFPQGKYSTVLLETLAELGYVWARSLINGIDLGNQKNNYLAKTYNLVPTITATNAVNMVDEAIAVGGTLTFLTHKLVPESELTTDTMYWGTERYNTLADKVKSEMDAGRVCVPTVSEISK
ncbi:polysaccharide deacetylase family protein [Listeria booriae]|uniref:polysaccharide deacetylase family protein n=1 Tax=Listeria booriae TaxID=1552123 RepID=UPI0016291539|nr:polysaccharide deacetylase family protein [Listeria booriae]MBC2149492.1 polysaccharide deacetylase family protein [Listeria booriae]